MELRNQQKPIQFAKYNTTEEILRIRKACRIASDALTFAKSLAIPGKTTEEIDYEVAHYIINRGAYPSGFGFQGFPKAICISPNEVVVHGVPNHRKLKNGDIVNFDVTCYFEGLNFKMVFFMKKSSLLFKIWKFMFEMVFQILNLERAIFRDQSFFLALSKFFSGFFSVEFYLFKRYVWGL